MLIASITQPTIEAILKEIEQARPFADAIEVRLDFLQEEQFQRLGELFRGLPLLFTFRKEAQGGVCSLPESRRLALIEKALEFLPAYCDLEVDTDPAAIERIAKKFPSVRLIGSTHNFEETPQDLAALLQKMKNPHFSFYKIALRAHSTIDMLRLMAFAREHAEKTPLCCISMGPEGKPSRILGPIAGNAFNYSGVEEEAHLHRPSLAALCEIYHFRKLNRETELYALLGDPVEQSIGDLYHNEQFRKDGRNAVYVKLRLRPEELSAFFQIMPRLPFRGFSVTMPLKEAILPYLSDIDPKAGAIGAVNTLRIGEGIFGTNTDAAGALDAIENHLSVKNRRVAILGAGGSAKAIAHEARSRGAHVVLFNRTLEKARALGFEAYALSELPNHSYDLLINTIPAEISASLIPGTFVMDIVYAPKQTPLLAQAEAQGCRLIYGEEMFFGQARLQQLYWFIPLVIEDPVLPASNSHRL